MYHVLNRANARMKIFNIDKEYQEKDSHLSHLWTLLAYVECNPLRAKLVKSLKDKDWK